MAADIKRRKATPSRSTARDEPARPTPDAVLDPLAPHATRLRLRRGQNLALAPEGGEAMSLVRSGALMLHVTLPNMPRQIVAMLLPGDMLRSSYAPPHANASLTSANAAEVWRVKATVWEGLAVVEPALARFLEDVVADQMARQTLHIAALGGFTGEQRAATVLIELGMRTGLPCPSGGLAIDMPFSRREIADYLGLNADTLSRIMSRLRHAGILGPWERSRVVVRDFRALAGLSPAARALAELNDRRGEGPRRSGSR